MVPSGCIWRTISERHRRGIRRVGESRSFLDHSLAHVWYFAILFFACFFLFRHTDPARAAVSLRTSDRDFCFESLGSRQNFQYGLIKHSSKKYTIPSTTETGFDGQKHVCIFADAILAHEAGTVRTRAGSNLKLLQRTNILVIVVSLR